MSLHVTAYNFDENTSSISFKDTLKTSKGKKIMAGVLIVCVLLTVGVLGFIIARHFYIKSEPPKNDLDLSHFHGINLSVDPCSNFYEFACGRWPGDLDKSISYDFDYDSTFTLLKNIVSEKRKNIFMKTEVRADLPRVVNDALIFYNKCKILQKDDLSDIDFILQFLDKIGGWPVLDFKNWNEKDFDWIRATSYLLKDLDIETVFSFQTMVNETNPSLNVLYIKAPSPKKEEYMLKEYFNKQLLLTLLYTLNPDLDDKDVLEGIGEIENVELMWAKMISSVNKTNPVKISIRDLQVKFPQFNWLAYIQLVLSDTLIKFDFKLTENDTVVIDNLEYFEKIFSFMQSDDSKRKLANLFGWLVTQDLFILIPDVFLNYGEANEDEIEETIEALEKQCYDKVTEIYESSVDYLYVHNTAPHPGVKNSKVLVDYIKNAYRHVFATADWLDKSTKNAAIDKLNSLQTVLGFKEYHANKTIFNNLFEDFPFISNSILETYFKIKQYSLIELVRLLKYGNDIRTRIIPKSITEVSAYYILQLNQLTIPISLYSDPFYYEHEQWYFNFAALGSIIGHEIFHAFDTFGLLRGANGELKNWFANSSLLEYDKRSDCFKQQYATYGTNNSYEVATSNENIADNVGLRMAYLAYKLWIKDKVSGSHYPHLEGYSADQMFFISFASLWCSKSDIELTSFNLDVHSNPKIRVIGSISNSEYFSRAFKCSKESPMNPKKKCYLW